MRYREAGFVGIALCMLIASSCTLEESKYERYRQKSGEFTFCPPQDAAAGSVLAEIRYMESGATEVKSCDRTSCPGDYSLAFEGYVCPVDFWCEQNVENPGSYYCTNLAVVPCVCTEDDVPNSRSRGCDEHSICIAKECVDNYHLKNGGCVKDSVGSCGASEIDCSGTQGWKSGDCINGVCKASVCEDNFHLLDDGACEVDSVMDCGSKGHACDMHEGVRQVACIDGECVAFLCNENYHKSQDDMRCEKDSYDACGSWNYSCGRNTGWLESEKEEDKEEDVGLCINSHCIALKCAAGYHLDKDSCFQDTDIQCGGGLLNCTIDGKMCSNGICVNECPDGEEKCEDGCYNTQTDVLHCGGCNTTCKKHESLITSCEAGECKFACPKGMGDCNHTLSDGCETELYKYGLIYDGNGNCSCNADEYQYAACGTTKAGIDVVIPRCIQDKLSEYGLKDDYGACTCVEPFTECGTISPELGIHGGPVDVPLCLRQGDYYSNYSMDNGLQFHNNADWNGQKVYYDYKVGACKMAVAFWKLNGDWSNYRYHGNKKTDWQGKDEWSSETCAVLCNSRTTFIESASGNNQVIDQSVRTFAHECYPKSTCNQFDTFDLSNGFYYDYGCKNGIDGFYHEKSCNE